MISLRRTKVLLLSASTIALVSGLVYAFFFNITQEKVNDALTIIDNTKNFETQQEKLSFTLSAIKEHEQEITKLDSYFIKEREIVDFTRQVEMLGTVSKTTIDFESLTPALGEGNTPTLDFRIKATGEFASVMHALELIENLPAKINVSSVKLARIDGSNLPEKPSTAIAVPVPAKGKPGVVPTRVHKVELPIWVLQISGTALNFIREK